MRSLFLTIIYAAVILVPQANAIQGLSDASPHLPESVVTEAEPVPQNLQLLPSILANSLYFESSPAANISKKISSSSGLSFAASAIIPGLGQAANGNWIKSGIFLAIEAVAIYGTLEYRNRGRRGERNYENWADQNWSVVQYANWLVEYHDVHGITNPYIEALRQELNGVSAAFNPNVDWEIVTLTLLRSVERNTPFILTDDLTANNFSHVLPDYGSQQYYELISKYYQYQAGWRDYHDFHNSIGHTGDQYNQRYYIDRNGAYASPLFWEGVDRANMFNDSYRTSSNFRLLLIANHVFSAFDAYFTVRLKQNRLSATPSLLPGHQVRMKLRF